MWTRGGHLHHGRSTAKEVVGGRRCCGGDSDTTDGDTSDGEPGAGQRVFTGIRAINTNSLSIATPADEGCQGGGRVPKDALSGEQELDSGSRCQHWSLVSCAPPAVGRALYDVVLFAVVSSHLARLLLPTPRPAPFSAFHRPPPLPMMPHANSPLPCLVHTGDPLALT